MMVNSKAERYDWNSVFLLLIGASVAGSILFFFAWNAVSPEQLATETIEREKIEP